ncbi:response regulator transcription factor [Streptomyces sp. Je 1-4]|uniref:response regulator transcription factor n=1 Tax=Streptomyces TaxID=1883 RepID=UPI00140F3EB8|nr:MULTISPECIES: response regulator transcription factor [unclassified Streptomyces]MCR8578336.1 response regulator transcription factor [Streptomyces sp. Isolate_219]QIK07493.1 response regulator transcription factor [Streptomyces sp. ID38640]UYB41068.1 response regulator transcription factor [Streptomyces sp. Je 1-4]UZQ37232.1 response regulator transcription factor [Streptomyces sp. Je 1-4] [Streptomyces sp. Je 1-4 4N24]UZQ44649.1 response regulator transcription factor [Streptomyces sp. Je
MPHVLLIEDDTSVRDGMELVLRRHGHEVDAVATGEAGLELLSRPGGGGIELAVVDLMLPGIDGFEVCRRIRGRGQLPIIMLTSRGDDLDVVSGLEAGADDYVIKPITGRVLEARIRAALRRAGPVTRTDSDNFAGLVIDRAGLTVTKHGTPVPLPPTELRLLLELSAAPGRVFSREQLLELVWEHDFLGDSRLVDAAVGRLRAKLEDLPAKPRYIQTVRGFGYRFGPL